ncbi:MAG: hypothetical protein ACKVX7_12835 [Planctomycetota bacterium]
MIVRSRGCAVLLALASFTPLFGQPVNDSCGGALTLVDGVAAAFNTTTATADLDPTCGQIGNTVWYSYTASCDGAAIVALCGSSYDTLLAVYDGSSGCPLDTSTQVACNDDACPFQDSELSVTVAIGDLLYIQVGGFGGDFGAGTITVTCNAGLPANDDCPNAIALTDGVATPYSTFGSTADVDPTCVPGGGTVWYTYTAVGDGVVTVSLCGSSYDTRLAIFSGGAGCPVDTSTELACNDDSCGLQSEIEQPVSAGELLYIQVGGFFGDVGTGTIIATSASSQDITGAEVIAALEAPSFVDSAGALAAALVANGLAPISITDLALVTGSPARVWVCLGTFPNSHTLSATEGALLASYITAGIPVYFESAVSWWFEPPTEFHNYDGIDSNLTLPGDDSLTALTGLDYAAANFSSFIDSYTQDQPGDDLNSQLVVTSLDLGGPNAGVVWSSAAPAPLYSTGVFHDSDPGFGKVLCQSWEFGGFGGDQNALAAAYIAALAPGGTGAGDFRRGDANGDAVFNIADAIFLLSSLFLLGSPPPTCEDSADVNDDGVINIADPIAALSSLFVSGSPPPPAPFPNCGSDPTSGDPLFCGPPCI